MTETARRKPLLKPKPSGKFKIRDFQKQDLAYMSELPNGSANWSEMGSFKTSTAEWLLELKTKNIPNPRILIITTKTGKGPYLESLWEVLPEFDVYVVDAKKTSLVIKDRVTPWNVELPTPLQMRPVIVLAHYHCFTNRACLPQQKKMKVTLPNGKVLERPKLLPDGTIDMVIPRNAELLTKHWDLVICDEAHRLKNYDSQWTRNIKKIKANYKHIMTGTGFVNNPAEIWSLLDFLFSGKRESPHANMVNSTGYWKFREYFCEESDVGGYRKIVGIKPEKEDEFKELVRAIGVRRTMLECFPNITEPIETVIGVDLSPTQAKMYQGIQEELWALDQQGVPLHSPTVLSMLNRLRQISDATPEVKSDEWNEKLERREIKVNLVEPSSKLDAAMEVIEGLEWDDERHDQVVVFCNFKQPLDLLAKRLDKAKIPYLHLKAEMNDKQRFEYWHEIWPTKKHMVFLSTLDLGAESINLSTAHRAIFIDQSWSPAKNKQAIGRVYRPGQTGAVQLIYIRARNTVDYRVLDTVNQKHSWFQTIFGNSGSDGTDEVDTDETGEDTDATE